MPYAVKFYAYIFMANVLAFVIVARWLLSYSRSLGGVAAAQSNISLGTGALASNTTGANNTANGLNALVSNTTGGNNTAPPALATMPTETRRSLSTTRATTTPAFGDIALSNNSTGSQNSAIGANRVRVRDNRRARGSTKDKGGSEKPCS